MSGLLEGLSQFGLGNFENASIFETEAEKEAKNGGGQEDKITEKDLIFDKSYSCPVCDKEFKSKTVKTGKAKLVGTDLDLRPKYDGIDMVKYDVVMCPHCGYAALTRHFKHLSDFQAKKIRESISASFKEQSDFSETYSYDEALERYKLSLANAIVKQAKASEKAYICLKTAWLLRSYGENLDETADDYADKKQSLEAEEKEFLKTSMEGFITARSKETYPMCGMDEMTVDYLIGVLAMGFEKYDIASKMISGILANSKNPRMKDKARDLKEIVMEKMKAKKK